MSIAETSCGNRDDWLSRRCCPRLRAIICAALDDHFTDMI